MALNPLSLVPQAQLPSPELVVESLPIPVLIVTDASEIAYANAAAQASFGGWVVGLFLRDLFPEQSALVGKWLAAGVPQVVLTKADAAFEAVASPVCKGYTVVTLQPARLLHAVRSAEVDELTGLYKRNGITEALERAMSPYSLDRGLIAVHCLDLDRFKIVNDTLGHAIGDLLLKTVADRLRSACSAKDCIARIGGDEFVIVQTGLETQAEAEKLAARIVDLVGRTYVLGGHTVNIGVSVGVALHQDEPLQPRDLVRNGDLALYEAKRAGRARYRMFETGMDSSLRERRDLEIELRRALALRQFELHYQPLVELDAEGDKVTGFEALLRWNHPGRGQIAPLDFIPLAEETGLINQIGEWVLRTACITAASWPDDLMVAVNISPVQFKADALLSVVMSALAYSGLSPHRLEIEITEGALLENTDIVLSTLHALRDLGVHISMDDFGTGYSSLSYLQKFPFSKIKIDRSFLQTSELGGHSEAIFKAIAGLGASLGLAITAEGVETAEQMGRIRNERCTHVQGYFTGRPMAAGAISSFLRS